MHETSGLHIAFGILSADETLHDVITNETESHVVSNETLNVVWRIFVFGLIPLFSVFGVIGNVLSLAVLYHQRMRNPTNSCLAALALSDLSFLIQSLLFVGTNIQSIYDPVLGEERSLILYPWFGAYASLVASRISSSLILLLTVERYIAVCFPIRAKLICNTRCTIACLMSICLVTIVLFLPYAFKYDIVYIQGNATHTPMRLMPSELGKNKEFFEIYGVTLNVIYRFVPITLVLVLNMRIIIITRKTCSSRKLMGTLDAKVYSNEQTRITLMLVTVSLLFVLCTLPGAIQSVLSHYLEGYTMTGQHRYVFQCFSYIIYSLETFSSSVNFLIYMVMSKKFSKTYKEMFCCLKNQTHYRVPCNSKESIRSLHKSESKLLQSLKESQYWNWIVLDKQTSVLNMAHGNSLKSTMNLRCKSTTDWIQVSVQKKSFEVGIPNMTFSNSSFNTPVYNKLDLRFLQGIKEQNWCVDTMYWNVFDKHGFLQKLFWLMKRPQECTCNSKGLNRVHIKISVSAKYQWFTVL